MVLEEPVGHVTSHGLVRRLATLHSEAFGEPGHVLFQCPGAPDDAHELAHTAGGLVIEPRLIGERDNAVAVGRESDVAAGFEADVAGVRVDQPGLVQAVASHDASHAIGDQALAVLLAVGARKSNPLFEDIRAKLALQAIGFDDVLVIALLEQPHLPDGSVDALSAQCPCKAESTVGSRAWNPIEAL